MKRIKLNNEDMGSLMSDILLNKVTKIQIDNDGKMYGVIEEDIKLKPCPFCGEKEIKITTAGSDSRVYCPSCGILTKWFLTSDKGDLIKFWNRRVQE